METLEEIIADEMNEIELCTFSDEAEDYCKVYVVPKVWFTSKVESRTPNGRKIYQSFDRNNFSDTFFLYKDALKEGAVKKEYSVR